MNKRLFGVLGVALATSGLLAGAGQASATSTISAGKAVGALHLMTPTQYQAAQDAKEAGRSVVTSVAGSSAVRPNDPPSNWYDIYGAYTDERGRDVPVRQGYSDAEAEGVDAGAFGYNHTCWDHNMCNFVVFDKAITQETGTSVGNNKYQYEVYLVDNNLDIDADVLIVATQSRTDYEGEITPDGRPIGVITAYCQGYTTCPEFVNEVTS
jgi:hypothetical protein